MLGNIAFLEIYLQVKGDLGIEDQRGRNALHHAVANGHQQVTTLLCEFGSMHNLIERADKNGCTPLFSAIRYNHTECLTVLLQYNCNLFH
jgi:ankyrin repeat protein